MGIECRGALSHETACFDARLAATHSLGWSASQRVVQNALPPPGSHGPALNLASQVLGTVLRVLPASPEAPAGPCDKASQEPSGFSHGYSRHRADFHIANKRSKKAEMRPARPAGARFTCLAASGR